MVTERLIDNGPLEAARFDNRLPATARPNVDLHERWGPNLSAPTHDRLHRASRFPGR